MSEERGTSGSPSTPPVSARDLRWVWPSVSGVAAALLGAAIALDPDSPLGSEVGRLLSALGLTILAAAAAHYAFPARTTVRGGGPAETAHSETIERGPAPVEPRISPDAGPSSLRLRRGHSSRSRGNVPQTLQLSAGPGDFLWGSWSTPQSRLPGELVGPVPETAYTPRRAGAPVLHEEGEPIFIGPTSEAFSRAGGYAISAEGLGPLDPLPSMIPLSFDDEPEWDLEVPRSAGFSGPGSSLLHPQLRTRILEEAVDRAGRRRASPYGRSRAWGSGVASAAASAHPSPSGPARRPSRTSTSVRVGGGPLPGPRARADSTLKLEGTARHSGRTAREPTHEPGFDSPMTLGDLVARNLREGGSSRSSGIAKEVALSPPARPRPPTERPRVRCANCTRTFSRTGGSRRCAACLRRICPDCAGTAPRSQAGAWCSSCSRIRELDAFSSEVDRRVLPGGEWAGLPDADPYFGALMG